MDNKKTKNFNLLIIKYKNELEFKVLKYDLSADQCYVKNLEQKKNPPTLEYTIYINVSEY